MSAWFERLVLLARSCPKERCGRRLGFTRPMASHRFRKAAVRILRPGGRRLFVLSEPLDPGWEHPCTPEDLRVLLEAVPRRHWRRLRFLILHQPGRGESSFAWVYPSFRHLGWSGAAIGLHAVPRRLDCTHRRPLDGWRARELGRQRRLGAELIHRSGETTARLGPSAARAWTLYHLLLHEIGHLAEPWATEERVDAWADALEAGLRRRGVIPFDPRPSLPRLLRRQPGWSERIRSRVTDPGGLRYEEAEEGQR